MPARGYRAGDCVAEPLAARLKDAAWPALRPYGYYRFEALIGVPLPGGLGQCEKGLSGSRQ